MEKNSRLFTRRLSTDAEYEVRFSDEWREADAAWMYPNHFGYFTMSSSAESQPIPTTSGMAGHAASGTGWTAAQGVLNKVATMVATFIVAKYLSPDDFAMSALALGLGGFLVLLPPTVMSDVLITYERQFKTVTPICRQISTIAAVAAVITILLAIPVFVGWYSKFPGGTLTALLMVYAIRPVGESLSTIPLSELRQGLRYKSVAIIDGGIQLCATLLTVVMAITGAGALALVMPQAVVPIAKAILYRTSASRYRTKDGPTTESTRAHHQMWRKRLTAQFLTASSAQYVHTLIGNAPILVLGLISTQLNTGFYTFSFYLAVQVVVVISYQLSMVLQPIFVKLATDPVRQASAYLRVLRAVAAVAVPVSLLQAALAEPIFKLFFDAKWVGAIPVFAFLSIGQAFYFAIAPTMGLLRAKRHFRKLLVWQLGQLAASILLYALAAYVTDAAGVAAVDTAIWAISAVVGGALALQGTGNRWTALVRPFMTPWIASLPIACATWLIWLALRPLGTSGAVIAVGICGPIAGLLSLFATKFTQPLLYKEFVPILNRGLYLLVNLRLAALSVVFRFNRD